MNILPKKNWHVRNQDNRDRVRRDEEQARLEKKNEEERVALTEQEVRLSLLRGKHSVSSTAVEKSQHFNLFAEDEIKHTSNTSGNKEYSKEKKEEEEKYQKQIGLLTYVGQSAIESQTSTPWYLASKQNVTQENNINVKDDSQKSKLDPMSIVEESLNKIKRSSHKKKKKHPSERSSSKKSIEELRSERLRRERFERERADRLVNGTPEEESKVESDPHRYSSQFNPHLARKKHRNHPY